MNRRKFLKNSALLSASTALGSGIIPSKLAPLPTVFAANPTKKVRHLILGIDGMDIQLAKNFMQMGFLPNFKKLADIGILTTAATSFPPQSPVAWSSFTVGGPTHVHGIYDFIHRDPATMIPYLSTSKVSAPEKTIKVAGLEIPLSSGKVENLRKGRPFWDFLADYDIPTTIYKMPGNFPCEHKHVDMISGMGTPDLRGGYGSFTLFSSRPPENTEKITGGMVVPLSFVDGYCKTELQGPENTLKQDAPSTAIPVEIWRDSKNEVVRLVIQEHEFLLKKGEWTGWLQLTFPMLKYISDVKGICKVFIKNVHPDFQMYVSPINIDPSDPVLPIVSSENYGKELAKNLGAFYTQGMPEDTKALSYDILNNSEYLELAYQIIHERKAALRYEMNKLARLDQGLLFFYFSSLDQDTHMFWRTIDPKSPLYTEALAADYGGTLRDLYMEMDQSLGEVFDLFDLHDPNFRLTVMSDHGFGPFRRQVNLNSWLHDGGFIALYDTYNIEDGEFFSNVNWNKTAAYALGINAIYLNLENRERFGSLAPFQARNVAQKIRSNLLQLRDPADGTRVVTDVRLVPDEEKQRNPHAPDLIVGWNRGYRTSWSSILGGFEKETIKDNDDRWSGDHCIDPALVPAILFSNKAITKRDPTMLDITATILNDFGIQDRGEMIGSPLYHG